MKYKSVAKKLSLNILTVTAGVAIFAILAVTLIGECFMPTAHAVSDAKSYTPKLIAHFSTYYGESSPSRKHNIELASRKVDGTVLYPEDEFSFNETVGMRTKANGFEAALIIQDGTFVEGVGGGVCQVSSTIYNCALLAGLDISHVRPHSLPVSYVAPSFDAMVSSATDFRFVNTMSGAVTLKVKTDGMY
ncbi:MAG: VanW family protein, partial [Clostridia bacterium]|nr:VanW family protein [Clostridia bacterium]